MFTSLDTQNVPSFSSCIYSPKYVFIVLKSKSEAKVDPAEHAADLQWHSIIKLKWT